MLLFAPAKTIPLLSNGFSEILIKKSSYGDTFHIKAIKDNNSINTDLKGNSEPDDFLSSYLDKVKLNLINFEKLFF